MNCSVIVATYGADAWRNLAYQAAIPSAHAAGFSTVLHMHDPIANLATVRNVAARKVTTDWIIFLDADDTLAPGYHEAMHWASASYPKLALLTPRLQLGNGEPTFPNRDVPMTVLNHCPIGTAVRRVMFLEVGGFAHDLPIYEDWDLWLRCLKAEAEIVDVPDAVYRASLSRNGRNSQDVKLRQQTYHLIRARRGIAG